MTDFHKHLQRKKIKAYTNKKQSHMCIECFANILRSFFKKNQLRYMYVLVINLRKMECPQKV